MSSVYILGAGASAGYEGSLLGEQCPVAKNFFEVACRVINVHKCGQRDFHDYNVKYRHFEDFILKRFLTPLTGMARCGVTMEDILTFIDIELNQPGNNHTLRDLLRVRREFLTLVAMTFEKVLYGPPCPYHGRLASTLGPGDTVISFNYDLLMDTALNNSCPHWHIEDGYGIDATMVYRERSFAPPNPGNGSTVRLLKPHGSFNWMLCRTCGNFYTFAHSGAYPESLIYRRHNHYPGMNEPQWHDLDWIIIPPSLKKEFGNGVISRVWENAAGALESAENIIIIGYSLPPTDFYTKRLLHYSLAKNKNLRYFEIVDLQNEGKINTVLEKFLPVVTRGHRNLEIVCRHKTIKDFSLWLGGTDKGDADRN